MGCRWEGGNNNCGLYIWSRVHLTLWKLVTYGGINR